MPELVTSWSARVGIPLSIATIGGSFFGVGAGGLCWLVVDSDLRTVLSVAGSFGLLAAAVIWWAEYRSVPLHEVTRTVEPEPEPTEAHSPIVFTSYLDKPKDGGRMARFVADSRESSNQRALRKRGWSETEIASRRDRLIEQNQAVWIDDKDHRRGWRLL